MKKFFIFFSIIVSLFFIDDIYATYDVHIVDLTNGNQLLHRYTFSNNTYTDVGVIDKYISFSLGEDSANGQFVTIQFQQPISGEHVLGVSHYMVENHYYRVRTFYCWQDGKALTVRAFHLWSKSTMNVQPVYRITNSTISPFGPNTGAWSNFVCHEQKWYFSPTLSQQYDIIMDYTNPTQYTNFSKWQIDDLGISDIGITKIVTDVINSSNVGLQSSIDNVNQSVQDSIDNANKNHQEQMVQEQKNHDDFMNSDSDSSFNEDTSSYDEYEKAEKDLMDSTNVDTSDLNFDVSSYSKPFKWIWDTITSFFQSSSKVFMAVTSTLILSFVGLVVGRG